MSTATTGRGRGRGKVILLGEHAVVYGHAALAAALERGVQATARPMEGTSRLVVDAWNVDTDREPTAPPARALEALVQALGVGERGWTVEAHADVPSRAGLGSSAALAVAVVRALADATGRTLEAAEVESLAARAEGVFHGNPSGVDVALATRGGLGLFRRGDGLAPIERAPFTISVGLSGEPRDTAARVAHVAALREADGDEVDAKLARLGGLAEEGARILATGAPAAELGPLLVRAQDVLAALGLSSPTLERMCELATRAGASGAKLTGAGGGGAVIAVGADDAVVRTWRAAGFEAFSCEVGA